MAPKRPASAYFVYCEEYRQQVKAELDAGLESGKTSVADVAKELGKRWKGLSEEDKQKYKDRAQEAAVAAKQELEASGTGDPQLEESETDDNARQLAGLPVSVVKRVIMCDKDIKRVSSDSVKLVSKAAELFIDLLATSAGAHASSCKRKTIKFNDLMSIASADKRLIDMGLKWLFEESSLFETARKLANSEKEPKSKASKKNPDVPTAGLQPITNFFH